ncbi:cysteine synthase A [Pseudoflavonifractor phocaeensis]|uniref:cysteine synthase A n=1 Tax=Pseudoflavonifractor phocaeensis TaxID=1870988 RepID=UPI001957331F|nr:cysteine synthase A [Pseudoflavonifractor phocaeensis]MBM6926242.1 cysteine synthase A [Pseudoflavonifractor phocaeensis]
MKYAHTISELIGNTPLLRLSRFAPEANLLAKLESFNPLSSAKDRAGLYMILDAEERGLLKPGAVIVEPTSGNTGVALAYIGRVRGYKVMLTMPETMSQERRSLLSALGAELVLTEGAKGMSGAIAKAKELLDTIPGAWMPDQFNNQANARAHYETTGPEIWRDTDGKVDVLVAGVGSGGTITGAGRYLKEQNSTVTVVAVEPAESPVLSGGKAGPHKIQGIGAGFVPGTLDMGVVDLVLPVPGLAAMETAKTLARTEGVLAGISSGAAAWAAMELSKRPEFKDKTIVTVLPDTGERYLSTGVFQD